MIIAPNLVRLFSTLNFLQWFLTKCGYDFYIIAIDFGSDIKLLTLKIVISKNQSCNYLMIKLVI